MRRARTNLALARAPFRRGRSAWTDASDRSRPSRCSPRAGSASSSTPSKRAARWRRARRGASARGAESCARPSWPSWKPRSARGGTREPPPPRRDGEAGTRSRATSVTAEDEAPRRRRRRRARANASRARARPRPSRRRRSARPRRARRGARGSSTPRWRVAGPGTLGTPCARSSRAARGGKHRAEKGKRRKTQNAERSRGRDPRDRGGADLHPGRARVAARGMTRRAVVADNSRGASAWTTARTPPEERRRPSHPSNLVTSFRSSSCPRRILRSRERGDVEPHDGSAERVRAITGWTRGADRRRSSASLVGAARRVDEPFPAACSLRALSFAASSFCFALNARSSSSRSTVLPFAFFRGLALPPSFPGIARERRGAGKRAVGVCGETLTGRFTSRRPSSPSRPGST